MKILPLLITILLISVSLQYQSYTAKYPHLSKDSDASIKCMEIDDDLLKVQGDSDDYYLCLEKEYLWLIDYLSINFKKHPFEVQCYLNDEAIQKFRAENSKPYLVVAQQQDDKVNISYFSLTLSSDQTKIIATNVTLPDHLRPQEKEIQQLILEQIEHKRSHDAGGGLFRNALILIIILALLVFGAYWWKKKQMNSVIDKQPADLQEAMLSKMELQAEEEKRKLSSSNNLVRKSQPAHMTEMTTISPDAKAQRKE